MRLPFKSPRLALWTTLLIALTVCSVAHGLTSTYYVAPTGSNSNPGTEADPFQTVSWAIQQASSGDEIILREGTYNESLFIGSASPSDLTFSAFEDESPVLAVAPGSTLLTLSGASSIHFEGIGFQGGAIVIQNADDITFTGCSMDGLESYSMVTIFSSSGVQIRDSEFANGRFTSGIFIDGPSDSIAIEDNTFIDNFSPGASVQSLIFIRGQTPSNFIRVKGNTFLWTEGKSARPVVPPGGSAAVIWIQNSDGGNVEEPRIQIIDNLIEDFRLRGTNDDQWYNPAYLKTPAQGGEQGNALSVLHSSHVLIADNRINRISAYGVNGFMVDHLRIERNEFRGLGKNGVFLVGDQGSGTGAAPNLIADNRIHNCGWLKGGTSGVSTIFAGPGNLILRNFISGQRNGIAGTAGADWYGDGNGILADLDSPGTIIVGNVVVHNEGAGISMNRSSNSVVIHNTVIGNGSMPHRSDNAGILIAGNHGPSDNITVINNLVYNNRLAQFWVWMTALNHTERYNVFVSGPLTVPARQNMVIDWFGSQFSVPDWKANPPVPGNGVGSIGQRPIFLGDLIGGDPKEDLFYYLPVNGSAGTAGAQAYAALSSFSPPSIFDPANPFTEAITPLQQTLLSRPSSGANLGALEPPAGVTQGWLGTVGLAHSTPNSAFVWSVRLNQFLGFQNGVTTTPKLGSVTPMGQDDWLISSRFGFLYAGNEANPTNGWMWSERFGWMKFVDGYLWSNHLQTWFDVRPDGTFHSFDFGFFNPIGGSLTRYNTRIGPVTANADVPAGWLASDRFGFVWFARDGSGVWFWSTNRNEWIGISPQGGLWSTAEQRFLD